MKRANSIICVSHFAMQNQPKKKKEKTTAWNEKSGDIIGDISSVH